MHLEKTATIIVSLLTGSLFVPVPTFSQTYAVFDGPGVTYTIPQSINASGVVAGYYCPSAPPCPGFTRDSTGTITSFNPDPSSQQVAVGRIIFTGAIAGSWFPTVNIGIPGHGYLRSADGSSYTTFDVAGATATYANGMNDNSVITGSYTDSNSNRHCFIRDATGSITTFEVSGAVSANCRSINDNGDVTGYYTDASNQTHGFVRNAGGTVTTFDVMITAGPAAKRSTSTYAWDINGAGTVVGWYTDGTGAAHGYVRSASGVITTFDTAKKSTNTVGQGINSSDVVTGYYTDATGTHGFVRQPNTKANAAITTFDAPSSTGTTPGAINDSGVITGVADNASGRHGFVRTP
jgi:hypothetical protein